MALPIRARPRLLHSQPLLTGSFHKLLILLMKGGQLWALEIQPNYDALYSAGMIHVVPTVC